MMCCINSSVTLNVFLFRLSEICTEDMHCAAAKEYYLVLVAESVSVKC